jgi:sugar/nucleoside kinase (ribokinase family)
MRVEPLSRGMRLAADYLTVGHVTVDVFDDGSHAAGGSALFSALLAARCGLTAAIVTAGDPAALEALLAPLDDDILVAVEPGDHLTTLATTGEGGAREQRVVHRAPDVPFVAAIAGVAHLAPVLREVGSEWRSHHGLLGLTPQGLVRRWDAGGRIGLYEPPDLDAYTADVVVLSEGEERYCGGLLEILDADALVVVTREERPASVRVGGEERLIAGFDVEPRSDIGAGDTFAAGLLIARAEHMRLSDAVAFAHAAAAAKVSGPGGAEGVPDRAAVERILATARRLGDLP